MRFKRLIIGFCWGMGTVTIASCGGGGQPSPQVIQSPDLSIAPSQLDFGTQLVAQQSPPAKATLKNIGGEVLTINSIVMTGDDPLDFVPDKSGCGSSLLPDELCTLPLSFTPGQIGSRDATLTVTDDSATSPHSIVVRGVGVVSGSNVTLSSPNLIFSNQSVDTTSPAQTVSITNYGTAALTFSSITPSADFAEQDTCGKSLATLATCTINVTFTPSTSTDVNGALTIVDDATDSPQVVSLVGSTGAVKCVAYGRQCSSTAPCCPGLKCQFSGGSTRAGYSCR